MAKYDPENTFEISVKELEYQDGLAVRVYQPAGEGPFPALVDVHGGVWTNGDRSANEVMDRGLAESGIVVAAVERRITSESHLATATAIRMLFFVQLTINMSKISD